MAFTYVYCFLKIDLLFWSSRTKNLKAIYEQLREDKVMKMAMILELTDSAYFPCFEKLFKSVVEGELCSKT